MQLAIYCKRYLFSLYSTFFYALIAPFSSPLFSRQRYVLGDNAMHQMAQSSVFLSGMGGLGIEIGRPQFKMSFNTSAMCLTLYSWCFASVKLDTERLTFVFTAKNIVLAGVKVCKPSIMLADCKGPLLSIFTTGLSLLFAQAVTLHDTKQCETWDLGSNFFIRKEDVSSQRRR